MNKPFAWSYSALGAFETCPHRFKVTRITKEIVEPQSEAMLWGNRVHKAFEDRLKIQKPFPDSMSEYEPIAHRLLKKAEGKQLDTEQKLALTRDFRKTTFFGKDVWLRIIIDVTIEHGDHVFVGDYKTGKLKEDSGQLQLSAAAIFSSRPWVNTITNSFIWLKEGKVTTEKFNRDESADIWAEFLPRAKRMEDAIAAGDFPKRPSGLCRAWCPVHSCEHNGKYTGD
jgi:hypothetical protein